MAPEVSPEHDGKGKSEDAVRLQPDLDVAVRFLQQLHPGAPWVTIIAAIPDGKLIARSFSNPEDMSTFIGAHNDAKGIYYSTNQTKVPLDKKAKKEDIAQIIFIFVDLDPKDDETPEAAKARYLEAVKSFPTPSIGTDSGNGVQFLWRLKTPHGPEYFDRAEAISKALMVALGAKAGTQNIDRILRVPGTVNLPNKKKRSIGRVPCMAKLLWADNGLSYTLDDFPQPEDKPGSPADGGHYSQYEDDEDELWRTIRDGGEQRHGETKSHQVWYVAGEMIRRGYLPKTIVAILLDKRNGISAHIYEQGNPVAYARRQVTNAIKEAEFTVDKKKGTLHASQNNIRVALAKMGVTVRYDRFADRTLLDGLEGFGPTLDDAALIRIKLTMERRFKLFVSSKEALVDIVADMARLNSFHPVCDYLDSLTWDGKERLDTWLTDYGDAENTEYTRAVGALTLIAAVRRVRQPGCKFDEMLVLESDQGTNRSTALSILAVREEWFHDDLPLNLKGKEVIEALRGRWIVEAAELSGMRKADIEHLKAFLSRRIDRARMAYGRIPDEVRRQSIFFGTTNDATYLRDSTGNRRVWPIGIGVFNLEALARDVPQLWAEAATREANGASIRLDPSLWPAATIEQEQRLIRDPFYDTLQAHIGDLNFEDGVKISSEAVCEILDLRGGQRTHEHSRRISTVMTELGWRRPNSSRMVSINGKNVVGYVKGGKEGNGWRYTVEATRDKDGLIVTVSDDHKTM